MLRVVRYKRFFFGASQSRLCIRCSLAGGIQSPGGRSRVLESFSPDMPTAMSVAENKVLTSVPNSYSRQSPKLGEPIARGFSGSHATARLAAHFPRNSSGRLQLAQWLASSAHPLTARVYVNRVWRWHFGAGLVGSTEEFWRCWVIDHHPELLDWLARNFIESGWLTKDLHRLIMRSSCYQTASAHRDAPMQNRMAEIDADNKWLSTFRLQRLDAEQIRDSILFVSGRWIRIWVASRCHFAIAVRL